MTIETRELIIKTDIKSKPAGQETEETQEKQAQNLDTQKIKLMKQQILAECLRFIKDRGRRDSFNR